MKKIILSLAALMMLMAAPVMTSCSNDMDEVAPAVQSRMATIEIAFPDQAETRAVIEDTLTDKKVVTAWKAGDKVTLAKVTFKVDSQTGQATTTPMSLDATAEFTYVSGNTFRGELPAGISNVSEFNFAAHHATIKYTPGYVRFSSTTKASTDLAEVLMMVGQKDGDGNIKMKIGGNYIKLVNNASDVSVAFRIEDSSGNPKAGNYYDQILGFNFAGWTYPISRSTSADGMFFTIKGGGATNYIFFGHWGNSKSGMGLTDASDNWILPAKKGTVSIDTGKIYNGGVYSKP